MSDIARACNQQYTNSEWKRMRLEKEKTRLQQILSRRKHCVADYSRFEDHYHSAERAPKSRGRGIGWQERQDRQWSGASSSSTWHSTQWQSDSAFRNVETMTCSKEHSWSSREKGLAAHIERLEGPTIQ
eukprot:5006971-Amphidinium_carterae.3